MRFIGDVPIGRVTIEWLEQRGHDCVSLHSRLPSNAPDGQIVAVAREEARVILCFDLDFSAILALSEATAPSVITFRTSRRSAHFINQRLEVALPALEEFKDTGFLAVVEDARVRVRPLPIRRRVKGER